MAHQLNQSFLETVAAEVGAHLRRRGEVLVTAESCTGGWVGQCLTAIAGSSSWYDGGFVTYSNTAKRRALGVPESTLIRHGAVSEETARAMALGALEHSGADWSLSVTGIAGPAGGSSAKPVGTVCFAWARRDGECTCTTCHFDGDRQTVRMQAVSQTLCTIRDRLAAEAGAS